MIALESELACDSLFWLHNFFHFLSMKGALEITSISEFSEQCDSMLERSRSSASKRHETKDCYAR